MSGVTITGFDKKTVDDIIDDVGDYQKANINAGLQSKDPTSVIGQINGSLADPVRELWDVAQATYRSMYPDSASGDALDNVCAITGVYRQPASYSTVVVTCNFSAPTVLPAGSQVAVAGVGTVFQTNIPNGVIAGDNDINFIPLETGPIAGPSGSLTVIVTPVSGWVSATNALDATLGSDIETDASLRARRETLLQGSGSSVSGSILTEVNTVSGVTQSSIFENVSYATDANGLPPKSFEVVVLGGSDSSIGDAIDDKKPIGIETYGTTTSAVGWRPDISFSRPVDVDIYSDVVVVIDPLSYPADGDDQIEAALVALGDLNLIGQDQIYERFQCIIFSVSGVTDITTFTMDTIPSPVGTSNITITNRQIAVWDTSRITVVSA